MKQGSLRRTKQRGCATPCRVPVVWVGVLLWMGTAAVQPAMAQPFIETAPGGGPAGSRIMIAGDGFMPGDYEGTIFWDGAKISSFAIPAGGEFNRVVTLPRQAAVGNHTISVCASFNGECFTGEFAQSASTPFEVTSELQPPLVISPASGLSGTVVTLTGHSYVPGGYAGSVLWDDKSAATFDIPYGGAFSIEFEVPVNTTIDAHTITVCAGTPCFTDEFKQAETVTFAVTDLLPVELVAFDAVADGDAVTLTWETASETNNAGFDVEQRADGADWTAVAFVEGRGTTDGSSVYTHRLDGLAPGSYAFRLKQIDFDGTFAYGPEAQAVVAVDGGYHLSAAYPNPFNPQTQFTLSVARTQHVTVAAYDLLGRRVQVMHAGELQAGLPHAFAFTAGGLAGGLYLIRVDAETFATSQTVTLLK